uniref:CVNH domain-containing protein n=1 Tax=Steinernema glaseri TaxID=37863 RepID=A0A1I8AIE1_9BILA
MFRPALLLSPFLTLALSSPAYVPSRDNLVKQEECPRTSVEEFHDCLREIYDTYPWDNRVKDGAGNVISSTSCSRGEYYASSDFVYECLHGRRGSKKLKSVGCRFHGDFGNVAMKIGESLREGAVSWRCHKSSLFGVNGEVTYHPP